MRATAGSDLLDVLFPRRDGDRVVAETSAYADSFNERLAGRLVQGIVLARDPRRDVALVELPALPDGVVALAWADAEATPGLAIHTVTHPTGADLAWLYAGGAVRGVGKAELGVGRPKDEARPTALLLQLPPQGGGGSAVADVAGRVVGVLASRDAGQQHLAYACAASEAKAFLEDHAALWKPATAAERRRRDEYLADMAKSARALAEEVARTPKVKPERMAEAYRVAVEAAGMVMPSDRIAAALKSAATEKDAARRIAIYAKVLGD